MGKGRKEAKDERPRKDKASLSVISWTKACGGDHEVREPPPPAAVSVLESLRMPVYHTGLSTPSAALSPKVLVSISWTARPLNAVGSHSCLPPGHLIPGLQSVPY